MKRFISIFFTFLFISLCFSTINPFAAPVSESKIFTQGIYSARDSGILVNSPITARLTSSNDKVMVIIVDSNLNIRELVKLGPQSIEHNLKPLNYDSSIIIFGSGSIVFS